MNILEPGEFEALKSLENWPFAAETLENMPVPIHKFTSQVIDGALLEYMGITLSDLEDVRRDVLPYLSEYDAYYTFTSDFGPGTFSCTTGERQADIIRFYGDGSTLVLREAGDGKYLFVSHMSAKGVAAEGAARS